MTLHALTVRPTWRGRLRARCACGTHGRTVTRYESARLWFAGHLSDCDRNA